MEEFVYGHSLPDRPRTDWEALGRHLTLVASGTPGAGAGSALFARAFGASEWGRIAGLWHDVGKYSQAFQQYICSPRRDSQRGPDHSTAGAVLASQAVNLHGVTRHPEGLLLAYAIAGHHGGLPDWADHLGGRSGLVDRLKKEAPEIQDALRRTPDRIKRQPHPGVPEPLRTLSRADGHLGLRVALFVRMLFSALVDADRLATEAFLNPEKAALRSPPPFNADRLLVALNSELSVLSSGAEPSVVRNQRNSLQQACRDRAGLEPGLFSLTAPTGSGKTLSSLAFALEHAKRHGLRRVIYALPFTSVTEQTAETFRRVFADLGDGIVLEHHSTASWRAEEDLEPKTAVSRLAAENWDAPIIVTTNVQLLESLFAARTSACRKLHRIAKSVVILDEAQALPVHLIHPTLIALDELARGYGTSVVLCSATMPALTQREGFPIGLRKVREIVPDPAGMAAAMRRVRVSRAGRWEDERLISEIAARPRVLAIVNRKKHAADVFRSVLDRVTAGVFHLSAAMCPAHRTDVLDRIKVALQGDLACRVVSTQVVEAGVDIDFPVVLRAMAGLDSIAQAAGRCNREGRLDAGEVIVFETEWEPAPMVARQRDTAREVLSLHDDPLSLDTVEKYFRLHYWQQRPNWDKHGIASREMFDASTFMFQFRQAASVYRVIEEQTTPILVPYGEEGRALIAELLRSELLDRTILRRAQRFTVSVRDRQVTALTRGGACEYVHDSLHVLNDPDAYDEHLGLIPDEATDSAERLASW